VRVHDLRHTAASLWLAAGADPKVVQRVLGHATAAEEVRPVRPGGHGLGQERLEACHTEIEAQVKQGLKVVKIGMLLERRGIVVSCRTLCRFCVERCGYGRTATTTVRVAATEPAV
jgi:hypothetical protein